MLRLLSIATLILWIGGGSTPPDQSPSSSSAAIDAADAGAVADTLASLADRFSRAYVAQDLEAIASAYTPGALALPAQGPIVQGRDSVAALFAMPEGARLIHHRIMPLHVTVPMNPAPLQSPTSTCLSGAGRVT